MAGRSTHTVAGTWSLARDRADALARPGWPRPCSSWSACWTPTACPRPSSPAARPVPTCMPELTRPKGRR
jgi:hypothetical protein